MRVGYVLDRFPSVHQTFVLNEMLALEARGVDIAVFSLLPPADVVHEAVARLRAPVVYAPPAAAIVPHASAQTRMFAGRPSAWISAARLPLSRPSRIGIVSWLRGVALAPEARRLRVDHLHAHFATGANVVAMVVARLVGVPFSFTTHAVDLYARSVLLCETLAAARFGVTSTEYNVRFISEKCGPAAATKVALVRACVDTSRFAGARRVPHSVPVILSVGRLIEKKGHRYLIDAAARLRDRGIAFAVEIVGDGPEHAAIDAAIERYGLAAEVSVRPPLTQDQLRALYDHVDIVALPCVIAADGDRDGIPVTLIEALAAGLPVISTTVSGIPELVSDEVGILVPPRDPGALADALAALLTDGPRREALGRAGVALVRRDFDVGASADLMVRLFEGAVPGDVRPGYQVASNAPVGPM